MAKSTEQEQYTPGRRKGRTTHMKTTINTIRHLAGSAASVCRIMFFESLVRDLTGATIRFCGGALKVVSVDVERFCTVLRLTMEDGSFYRVPAAAVAWGNLSVDSGKDYVMLAVKRGFRAYAADGTPKAEHRTLALYSNDTSIFRALPSC